MSVLTASYYCLWKITGGDKKKFMSLRKRTAFFPWTFNSDLRGDSRQIFKMQINEPLLLTAQQRGEGGGSDPHLPEKEPRWLQAGQEHELLQISARRGGIPHRPRGAAIRSAYVTPSLCPSTTHLTHAVVLVVFPECFSEERDTLQQRRLQQQCPEHGGSPGAVFWSIQQLRGRMWGVIRDLRVQRLLSHAGR